MRDGNIMIKISKLIHDYIQRDEEGNPSGTIRAINDVSLDVRPGQFIAILGHNGSGKSTLAKHLNALLFPTEGTVRVDGLDTKDESCSSRRKVQCGSTDWIQKTSP